MYIGIVNHHFTLFLGAMLEASSAPACLQTFKDLHMLRMNRVPADGSLILLKPDEDIGRSRAPSSCMSFGVAI